MDDPAARADSLPEAVWRCMGLAAGVDPLQAVYEETKMEGNSTWVFRIPAGPEASGLGQPMARRPRAQCRRGYSPGFFGDPVGRLLPTRSAIGGDHRFLPRSPRDIQTDALAQTGAQLRAHPRRAIGCSIRPTHPFEPLFPPELPHPSPHAPVRPTRGPEANPSRVHHQPFSSKRLTMLEGLGRAWWGQLGYRRARMKGGWFGSPSPRATVAERWSMAQCSDWRKKGHRAHPEKRNTPVAVHQFMNLSDPRQP